MKKGLTLIELIIALMLFGILVGAIAGFLIPGLRSWVSGRDRADLLQSADIAMQTMARDISQATTMDWLGGASVGNKIRFTADIDGDLALETVAFEVSANELEKAIGTGGNPPSISIAHNVQSLALEYIDANGATFVPGNPAGMALVRAVIITLTMNKADDSMTLSTSVFCRNM